MVRRDLSGKKVGSYLLTSIIGVGSAGDVYHAIDTSSQASEVYAVKCLPTRNISYEETTQITLELFHHLAVRDCQYVLPICDVIEKKSHLFIVLAWCETDMYKTIWKTEMYWRNDPLIKTAFIELLDGVHACHRIGISHRDLKPENLMCNANGTGIRIGDFGVATNDYVCWDGPHGSSCYMSPECLTSDEGDPYVGDLADVWSLGVILFNLATSCYPWRVALPSDENFMAFVREEDYFCQAFQVSESLNDLLRRMLHPDPMKRLGILRIRKEIIAMDTFYQWDGENSAPLLEQMACDAKKTGTSLAKTKKKHTFVTSSARSFWSKFQRRGSAALS